MNVRLVENRANKTVGNVMVVNVITQISNPGKTLAIANRIWPAKPSHEFESRLSERMSMPGKAWGVAVATESEAVLKREVKVCEAVDRLPGGERSIA